MAGMFNGGTRLTLNPGPGVTEDNKTRYKIATLTVGSAPTINLAAPSTLSGTPGGTILHHQLVRRPDLDLLGDLHPLC